jgi:hypothetical protein
VWACYHLFRQFSDAPDGNVSPDQTSGCALVAQKPFPNSIPAKKRVQSSPASACVGDCLPGSTPVWSPVELTSKLTNRQLRRLECVKQHTTGSLACLDLNMKTHHAEEQISVRSLHNTTTWPYYSPKKDFNGKSKKRDVLLFGTKVSLSLRFIR